MLRLTLLSLRPYRCLMQMLPAFIMKLLIAKMVCRKAIDMDALLKIQHTCKLKRPFEILSCFDLQGQCHWAMRINSYMRWFSVLGHSC